MTDKKSTGELNRVLGKINPERISDYLNEQSDSMYCYDNAFSTYMRDLFRKKELTQQEVFLRADMPERYGYKIISMEKHTSKRDVIIRICLAARFKTIEINRALKLYGFSELYSRIPRDAVIISAINANIWDIDEINDLLKSNSFQELYSFEVE